MESKTKLTLDKEQPFTAQNFLVRNPGRIGNAISGDTDASITEDQYLDILDSTSTPLTGFQFALSRLLVSAISNAEYNAQTRTYLSPTFTCQATDLIKFMGAHRNLANRKQKGTNNYLVALWVSQMTLFQTVYIETDPKSFQKHLKTINWIKTADYNLDTGEITLKLNEELFDYIGKQQRGFTTYKLYSLMTLPKRGYSMPLYEILTSYKSLIVAKNKKGEYYPLPAKALRKMLGISQSKRTITSFVYQVSRDIDLINENNFTGFSIDYYVEKEPDDQVFYLKMTEDKPTSIKEEKILEDSDVALYESQACLLYKKNLFRAAGKKFRAKIRSCYENNMHFNLVRAALVYTNNVKQKEEIKSIQAYMISIIEAMSNGEIKVEDKFWKVTNGDVLTPQEKQCYGDLSSAMMMQTLLVNKPATEKISIDDATPFAVYVMTAKYYAETEHYGVLKNINYQTLQNMIKWFCMGVDIRSVLTGIEKTCQQMWDDSKPDIVHTWEYVTKVVENDLKERKPYWHSIATLNVGEYKKNFVEM